MYPNFSNDRRRLGYSTLQDDKCGQRLIMFLNYDSLILKSILTRPKFFLKSSKKFKNKLKRWYSVKMVIFTVGTTAISNLNVMVLIPQETVNL